MSTKFNVFTGTVDYVGAGSTPTAADISSTPSGNLAATNVQSALNELQSDIDNRILSSEKASALGVATLDAGGKVPASQLPNSIMDYLGTWAASTNTPTLANGTGSAGDVYVASDSGSINFGAGSITFAAGDWVIYSGAIWEKSVNSNAVASVNSQTGAVVLDTDDISEGATNKYFTDSRAKTAVVDDSISNGVTDKAPSQNAVFDALALKQDAASTAADARAAVVIDSIADADTDHAPSRNAVFDALATISANAANVTLSNLTSTAINADLIPGAPNSVSLGSTVNNFFESFITRAKDPSDIMSVHFENRILGNAAGATVLNWSGTDLSVNTRKITNVVDPSSAQDAATKNYVDTSAGSAANTSLSNLSSVAINSNLIFGTGITGAVRTVNNAAGSEALLFYTGDSSANQSGYIEMFTGQSQASTNSANITIYTGDSSVGGGTGIVSLASGNKTTTGAGSSGVVSLNSGAVTAGTGASGAVTIQSGDNSSSGTGVSGTVTVKSGNKTSGTANSGDVVIQTGTATGTRGKIKFVDGSQGTAGHVWTSSDTAGNGYWAAAAGGGANTSLSNLAATTAINSNLIFGAAAAGVDSEVKVATPASGNGKKLTLSGGASNGAGSPGKVVIAAGLGNGTGTVEEIEFSLSKVQAGAHVAFKGAVFEVGSTFNRLRIFPATPTDTSNGDLRLQTTDSGAHTITAGNQSTGAGGLFTISGQSATDDASNSGDIQFQTAGKGGTGVGATGLIIITSGDNSSSGSGNSGAVTVQSGTKTGTGTGSSTGIITIASGANSGSGTGVTGAVNIVTGAKTNGTAGSGNVSVATGTATGSTGTITIASGAKSGSEASDTGLIVLRSGEFTSSGTGVTGQIIVRSGDKTNGSGDTGNVLVRSGVSASSSTGATGTLTLQSGDNTGSGTTASGAVTLKSGNKTTGTGNSGAITIQTGTATGTRGDVIVNTNNFDVTSVTTGKGLPIWKKYTVTHTALQAAATVSTIELLSLPAYGFIDKVVISHSTAFSGGAISAYTVEVGITGNLPKYASAFDVFQATGNTVGQSSSSADFENKATATSIKITARSTGANTNASTAGSVDVWVLYGTMQ